MGNKMIQFFTKMIKKRSKKGFSNNSEKDSKIFTQFFKVV